MFSENFEGIFINTNSRTREGTWKYRKKTKFSHFLKIEGEKVKYPDFFLNFPVIWVWAELLALALPL